MQVSCGIDPKVSEENIVGRVAKVFGLYIQTPRNAEGVPGDLRVSFILPDHIHMLISIPPKYSVSQVVGYLKGKSAIQIDRI